MNLDTNIDNYDLEDMYRLFNISNNITNENIVQMNLVMSKLNNNNSNLNDEPVELEIYSLFKKMFTILLCLHKYRDYQKIQNPNYNFTKEDDYKLLGLVKKIPNYEMTNDVNYLLNQILKQTTSSYNKQNDENLFHKENLEEATGLTSHPLVIDKIVNQFMNTFENKIVAGNVNSIKRITKLVNVHINSCFRDNYKKNNLEEFIYENNTSDFIYQLPKPFKNVVSMKLSSIEILSSQYLISTVKGNNTFIIEIGTTEYVILIPDGNYTSDKLVKFLNETYFYLSTTILDLQYISMFINSTFNKTQFKITATAPPGFEFSLKFTSNKTQNILETCGWLLGFRKPEYFQITDMILSEGLFDGCGDQYIYLAINDYQYNYNDSNIICLDKSNVEDGILAKIPLVNNTYFSNIVVNENNPLVKIRQYNGPVNLSKFAIKVFDKFGNIVDLNFMDFSFSLELEILYERNNIV
jgi:hypothetical protein